MTGGAARSLIEDVHRTDPVPVCSSARRDRMGGSITVQWEENTPEELAKMVELRGQTEILFLIRNGSDVKRSAA